MIGDMSRHFAGSNMATLLDIHPTPPLMNVQMLPFRTRSGYGRSRPS